MKTTVVCLPYIRVILATFFLWPLSLLAAESQPPRAKDWREQALEAGEIAVRLAPRTSLAYLTRSMAWREMGDLDKALADCDEAVRLDPQSVGAYMCRASLRRERGELDEAIADYSEAIKREPLDPSLFTSRAWMWTMKREADKAMADANEAIRLKPQSDVGYRSRMFAWLLKDDLEHASAELDKVIERDPKSGDAYFCRAAISYILGDAAKASANHKRATALMPNLNNIVFPATALIHSSSRSSNVPTPELHLRMLRGQITITKETTWATGPIGKHGCVDYLAALHEEYGRGMTPENNAAVPLWQAKGPLPISKDAERFYRLLGIPTLAAKGEYLVPLEERTNKGSDSRQPEGKEHAFDADQLWQDHAAALKRPWSKEEFPLLASWLEVNRAPAAKAVEASRRDRYYLPIAGGPVFLPMVAAVNPECAHVAGLAKLLLARAMLQLKQGNANGAWQDVLAVYRLSRLIGQGPSYVERAYSLHLEKMAAIGTAAVAHYGSASAVSIQQMVADLKCLPQRPKPAYCMRVERYLFLNCIQTVAKQGPLGFGKVHQWLSFLSEASSAPPNDMHTTMPMIWFYNVSVDWDEVMRHGNGWYDRIEKSLDRPTRAERDAAQRLLNKELQEMGERISGLSDMYGILALGMIPPEINSRRMADLYINLTCPPLRERNIGEDRAEMAIALARLSLSLAAYRGDHHEYPTKLADLAPRYIRVLPKDAFGDEGDLHYARQADGYLLYSVGPNGKDDGGRDRDSQPPGDDIAVRVPVER